MRFGMEMFVWLPSHLLFINWTIVTILNKMGYQIDEDGTIIRPEEKEKKGAFAKIMVLAAIAITLLLWATLGRRTDGVMHPSRELHHFVGNVGSNIHMSILVDGADVKGLYYYDAQRKNGNFLSLKLRGDKNGNRIRLTEVCNEETTGWFDGNLDSGVFKGSFTRARDGKVFDFNLFEVLEGGTGFFTENEIQFY